MVSKEKKMSFFLKKIYKVSKICQFDSLKKISYIAMKETIFNDKIKAYVSHTTFYGNYISLSFYIIKDIINSLKFRGQVKFRP